MMMTEAVALVAAVLVAVVLVREQVREEEAPVALPHTVSPVVRQCSRAEEEWVADIPSSWMD